MGYVYSIIDPQCHYGECCYTNGCSVYNKSPQLHSHYAYNYVGFILQRVSKILGFLLKLAQLQLEKGSDTAAVSYTHEMQRPQK